MKLIAGANGVRPSIKPRLFRSNKQKRWTLALVGPARVGGNLLRGRSPLLHMAYREPDADQHVQIATQRPVLFNDPFGQPIRPPRALLQIAVDRPDLAARRIRRPSGFEMRFVPQTRAPEFSRPATPSRTQIGNRLQERLPVIAGTRRGRRIEKSGNWIGCPDHVVEYTLRYNRPDTLNEL